MLLNDSAESLSEHNGVQLSACSFGSHQDPSHITLTLDDDGDTPAGQQSVNEKVLLFLRSLERGHSEEDEEGDDNISPPEPLCPVHNCQLPIDITLTSTTGTQFGSHKNILQTSSSKLYETALSNETNENAMRQSSTILSLLLHFAHIHEEQPDLHEIDFFDFEELAVEVEELKMEVARMACRLRMEAFVESYAFEVFKYATKYGYTFLSDKAAPYTINEPIMKMYKNVDSETFALWVLYRDEWSASIRRRIATCPSPSSTHLTNSPNEHEHHTCFAAMQQFHDTVMKPVFRYGDGKADSESDPDSSPHPPTSTPPFGTIFPDHHSDSTSPHLPSFYYCPSTAMELDTRPLAIVKSPTKLKDCPTLTEGRIDPHVFSNWSTACRRFAKHSEKKPTEIVTFIADAMLEPHLVAWYNGDSTRIDGLLLEAYLLELAELKIELQNLNATLTTTSPTHALDPETMLKAHLEGNMDIELKISLENEKIALTSTGFFKWAQAVAEQDDRLRAERLRTQRLIDQAQSVRSAVRRSEKKDLLSRFSDAPSRSATTSSNNTPSNHEKKFLPRLTDTEKKLLHEHEGCARCRRFYAGHRSDTCPMKKMNTWPDATSYVPLSEAMAKAAVPRIVVGAARASSLAEVEDEDTDSYVLPVPNSFSTLHFYADFSITGPSISEFPITVSSLLDTGCPSTVISAALVDKLGLRRRPLPSSEDNLSSLSQQPLRCTDYVKLELVSGDGLWKSGSVKAKVNSGLPVSLILGMSFLSAEHIVIDANTRTAIDKRTGYDLITPPCPHPRIWQSEKVIPPPTPKKKHPPSAREKPAELAGYLLPCTIIALVRDRIESISFQQLLAEKDAQLKANLLTVSPLGYLTMQERISLMMCIIESILRTHPRFPVTGDTHHLNIS
ncbi:hypothetical protein BDQ17DRAFT_1547591 [Cyathus striatus]|nr:hypothetical protein BDQ17DRAFT_1547591 [Cyathus striatus]